MLSNCSGHLNRSFTHYHRSRAGVGVRRTGILHCNLGCYEARLGDFTMTRRYIDEAIQINSAMARNAKADPDLQAL